MNSFNILHVPIARSAECPKAECRNEAKEQVNIVTQEIDDETDQVVFETLDSDEIEELCQSPCKSSRVEHAFVGIHQTRNSLDPSQTGSSLCILPGLSHPVSTFPSCTDTKGYAIVDTGARRSVKGIELLPQMMQMLDPTTRARVKEKPSCIGF